MLTRHLTQSAKLLALLALMACVPQEVLEVKDSKLSEKDNPPKRTPASSSYNKGLPKNFSSTIRSQAVGKGKNIKNARPIPAHRQREFDFMQSYELREPEQETQSLSTSSNTITTNSTTTTQSVSTQNVEEIIWPEIVNGFDYDYPIFLGTFVIERWNNSDYGDGLCYFDELIGPPDFFVTENTCTGAPISCYVEFVFLPLSEGYKQMTLDMEIVYRNEDLIDFDGNTFTEVIIQPLIAEVGGVGLMPDLPPYCEDTYPGSEIAAGSQSMRERVDIVGMNMDLVYSSNLAPEYASNFETLDRVNSFNPEGWTLSGHHYYSSDEELLFLGSGGPISKSFKEVDGKHLVVHGGEAYLFTPSGRHLETRDATQNTLIHSFEYDTENRLVKIINRFNQEVVLERDANGLLSEIHSAYGQVTQVQTDSAGRISAVTNPNQETHSFEYLDQTLLMTSFTLPSLKTTTFTYNETSGRLMQDKGAGGNEWNLHFSSEDNAQKIELSSKLGRSTQVIADRDLQTDVYSRQKIKPTGEAMEYIEHPDQSQEMSSAFKNVQRTTAQDERFLDLLNRPQSELTSVEGITKEVSFDQQVSGVDASNPLIFDELIKTTSVNNQVASSRFDAITNTLEEIDADGVSTLFEFNQQGLLSKTQRGSDTPLEIVYDSLGRPVQVIEGVTTLQSTSYDSFGRVAEETNALNQTTGYVYDNANRPIQIINPDSSVINLSYTEDGLLKTLTPPQRPAHEFIPNLFNLTAEYHPPLLAEHAQVKTRFSYNEDKQLTKIERADGRVIDYTYSEESGLLLSENDKSFSYFDNSDLLKSASNSYNVTTSYEHFGKEDLQSITQDDGSDVLKVELGHDNFFRRNQRNLFLNGSQVGSLQKSFSPAGRLESIADLSLDYEVESGRLSQTSAGVIETSRTYDAQGSLESFEARNSNTGEVLYRYSFERDALKRITQRQVEVLGQSDTFNYTYNSKGELKTLTKNGVLYSQYNYGPNGNLISGTINGSEVSATYDEQDRLLSWQEVASTNIQTSSTQVDQEKYDHPFKEKNNNGKGKAKAKGRCDNGGKGIPPRSDKGKGKGPKFCEEDNEEPPEDTNTPILPLEGQGSYAYNAHGELKTVTSPESTLTEYVRDNQGKIESVTLPNGDQITYLLDHRDRRAAKYKNGALVYKRLYQNELQVAMQINADGSVSEFIYATRINVPDLIKRDGQTYRVIMDHLGSPVLVVNIADGTILDQAQYNEWGRVIAQTNPTSMPFGFAGGLEDQDTKLVRFGARDYNPNIGRWISKDPIGFNGGDTNLYRYVYNNPVGFTDPSGKVLPALAPLLTACAANPACRAGLVGVVTGLASGVTGAILAPSGSKSDSFIAAFAGGFTTGATASLAPTSPALAATAGVVVDLLTAAGIASAATPESSNTGDRSACEQEVKK